MSSSEPECKKVAFIFLFFFLFAPCVFAGSHPGDSTALRYEADLFLKDVLLRSELVNNARQFLGLSYRYAGRSPETGFDCSGLTSYVMQQYKISLSPCSRVQATEGRRIPVKEARPGDIIAFKRSRTRPVSHVAMVVRNDAEGLFVIHSTSRGVVIDNLYRSAYWKPKIFEARDIVSDAVEQAVIPVFQPAQGVFLPTDGTEALQPAVDMLTSTLRRLSLVRV